MKGSSRIGCGFAECDGKETYVRKILEFFVLNHILSDLAILCKLVLKN